jgi:DNA polymerase-3 subunit epsilon
MPDGGAQGAPAAEGTGTARKGAGLRLRVGLLFAGLALGSAAAVVAGLWLAARGIDDPEAAKHLALAGAIGVGAIAGLTLWAWLKVDEAGVRPLAGLARSLQTLAHAETAGDLDPGRAAALGEIGQAGVEVAGALRAARTELATARAEAAAEAEAQKARLEALLRDLDEAVILSTRAHRIVLLNRRAAELLGGAGEVGLGRPLSGVLATAPLDHALERLTRERARAGAGGEAGAATTTAVVTTPDGQRTFRARVGLVEGPEGAAGAGGYVVTFRDITAEMTDHAARDRLLADALDLARRVAANISTTLDVAMTTPDLGVADLRRLEEAAAAEAFRLSAKVRELTEAREAEVAVHWPMDDVLTSDLFESVRLRAPEGSVVPEGPALWVQCDSLSVSALLAHLVTRLGAGTDGPLRLMAGTERNRLFVDLAWEGAAPAIRDLEAWLAEPLEAAPGRLTGREILGHHHGDVWPEAMGSGSVRLRMPLPLSEGQAGRAHLPDRPEFYDFGIDDTAAGAITDTALAQLDYVAFDTETTGLEPRNGDEIVQIAGVRIVNGRVLAGEAFDTLVNPARRIPALATRIHGISEEMVTDAPAVPEALGRFRSFVEGSVLIAHNAPFDMAFLSRDRHGVEFRNPVLDTVLLSAFLHDHTGQHSLDDLAMRFEVTIDPTLRHTALGDARATAEVFVRLLPLLASRGVTTLGEALAASGEMRSIRRAQARYA